MSTTNTWVHDPESVLDYTFDWTEWLGTDETIVSHIISISPSGHTGVLTVDSSVGIDKKVTVWLSGGRKNTKYLVSCQITTTDSRIETTSIFIDSRNK